MFKLSNRFVLVWDFVDKTNLCFTVWMKFLVEFGFQSSKTRSSPYKLTPNANQLVICLCDGEKNKDSGRVNFHCPKRYCNTLIDSLFVHYHTKGDFGEQSKKFK